MQTVIEAGKYNLVKDETGEMETPYAVQVVNKKSTRYIGMDTEIAECLIKINSRNPKVVITFLRGYSL
jgi:hypothetical protein